jgi:hypothetical protein
MKCKNGKNEVFLVAHAAMKSLYVDTGIYFYKVYNYHDSRACSCMRSEIPSRIEGMVWEWFWYGYGFGLAV